jgi:hypothetical protein
MRRMPPTTPPAIAPTGVFDVDGLVVWLPSEPDVELGAPPVVVFVAGGVSSWLLRSSEFE